MKEFGKVMLIIGMVIGSGFASGKEIAVFFSRFGWLSYVFIPIAFLLFFGVFYWILYYGKKGVQKFYSSKAFLIISVVVSLVFTSSMFAGTTATISTGIKWIDIFLIISLLIGCVIVSQKGVGLLAKINSYLIPFTIVVLFGCLTKNVGQSQSFVNGDFFSGSLFSILYVVMNVSTSCLVMGMLGQDMTKKQILIVSFFASLILALLLTFINFVLLGNEGSLLLSMPLLEISSGKIYTLMRVVIFLGCLTTLISLVFTISQSLKKLGVFGFFNIFISVFFPFFASFLGFGQIVSVLYPIVSVLGIFLLVPFLPWEKLFRKKE